MKHYTIDDIEIGSTWKHRFMEGCTGKVTGKRNNSVLYDFHNNYYNETSRLVRPLYTFLDKYEPVYTVEGFEV